jgi:hypothetical protein
MTCGNASGDAFSRMQVAGKLDELAYGLCRPCRRGQFGENPTTPDSQHVFAAVRSPRRRRQPWFAPVVLFRLLWLSLASVLLAGWSWGQEPAEQTAPIDDREPVVVLKQHVPYNHLTDYIKGFLPMSRSEFEAKLKRIATASEVSQRVRPHLGRGLYYARLEAGQLVAGRARLEVRHTDLGTGVLNFEQVGLAARKFRWETNTVNVPQVGLNAAGQFVILVNRSDHLLFDWSLRPALDGPVADRLLAESDRGAVQDREAMRPEPDQNEAGRVLLFRAELPGTAWQQWVLDLPSGAIPEVASGTAQPFALLPTERIAALEKAFGTMLPPGFQQDRAAGVNTHLMRDVAGNPQDAGQNTILNRDQAAAASVDETESRTRESSTNDGADQVNDGADGSEAAADAAAGNPLRRWLIELGGDVPLELQIVSPRRDLPNSIGPRLRQATDYRLSQAGVEMRVTCTLDLLEQPLTRLELRVDPNLQIVGLQVADEPWPLTMIRQGETADRLLVEFERPLQPGTRTILLDALSPLAVREEVTLPRIDVINAQWEQGTATLQVDSSLELLKLVNPGSVQTKLRASDGMGAAEIHEFQAYAPDARFLVTLELPQPRARVSLGTQVRLNESTLSARITVDLSAVRGELFVLDAQVLASWIIDSVVSVPEAALDRNSARTGPNRLLRLRFPQAIQPEQQVRLIINAHRRAPPAGIPLRAADFRILEFATGHEIRRGEQPGAEVLPRDITRVVCLQAEAASRVKTAGRAGVFKTLSELTPEQQALLEPFAGGVIYRDEHPADAFAIELTQERPQYAVQIVTEAIVEGRTLRLTHQIRCEPQIAAVASLFVQLGQATTAPLVWSVDGEPDEVLSARRVDNPVTDAGTQTETWQIALRRPRGQAFSLVAVGSLEFNGAIGIGLAAVPEASGQTGRLIVGTSDATSLLVDDTGLRAEAAPIPQPGASTWVRGVYRYTPTRDQVVHMAAQRDVQRLPDAWSWSTHLESRYEASGHARHDLTFAIQNSGQRQFSVRLPKGAVLTRLRVDGVDLGAARSIDANQRVLIPLPRPARLPVVQLTYLTAETPLKTWSEVVPAWPDFDLPSLDQTWKVWLPPGYEAVRNSRWILPSLQSLSGEERLFGRPVFRRTDRPFDLFSAADWRALVAAISPIRQHAEPLVVERAQERLDERLQTGLLPTRPEPITWGRWLAAYEQETTSVDSSPPPLLWLDLPALQEQGLRPDSPLDLTQWEPLTTDALTGIVRTAEKASAVTIGSENAAANSDSYSERSTNAALKRNPSESPRPSERSAGAASRSGVERLLEAYNLQFLATADGVLLTRRTLPTARQPIRSTDVLESGLTRSVKEASQTSVETAKGQAGEEAKTAFPSGHGTPHERVRVGDWLAASALQEYVDLAKTLSRDTSGSDVAPGWKSYLLRLEPGSLEPLGIYRPAWVRVVGWAAFFIVASLAIGLGRHRRWILILAGLHAAALLVIAPELIPILRGMLCGLLVGLIYNTFQPRRRVSVRTSESSFSVRIPTPAVSALVLIVLGIGATSWIAAQEAPPRSPMTAESKPHPRMFPVIIPVDEQRQPWGETLHVPEVLWKTLQRRTETLDVAPLDWLLRSANYQVHIEPRDMSDGLAVEKIMMVFELETFRPDLLVRLPFLRTEMRSTSTIRLNQGEVPWEWEAGSDQLTFRVPRPDRYYVEFSVVPLQQNDADTRGFQLHVPRLLTSRLKVHCPRPAELRLPSVVGALQRDLELNLIEAELGPTDQLVIRWPREEMTPDERPELFVEQSLWLQVRPTSLTLTTRFQYSVLTGSVSEVILQTDPRLRLSRLDGATSQVIEGNATHAIIARLAEPSSTDFALEATFVLADTSSIGRLHFPRVVPLADVVGPVWYAVNVSETVEGELHPPDDAEVLNPTVFLDQWGPAPTTPQYAYRTLGAILPWRIDLRPAKTARTVSQKLVYAVERDQATARFEVELQGDTQRCQYRLHVPAAVRVQRLELQQDAEPIPLRWARAGDELTLFLQRSVSGTATIRLHGDLPAPRRRSFLLPLCSLIAEDLPQPVATTVELFRRPGVLVTEVRADQMQVVEGTDRGRLEPQFGRLEGRFVGTILPNGPTPAIQLQISPNTPRVEGGVLQELARQENRWVLTTKCQLQVRTGLLDELRMTLPDTWETDLPFEFQPAIAHEVQASAQGRVLVVQPVEPISGAFSFQFRLNLSSGLGSSNNAPLARLVEPAAITHFLLLPNRSGKDELAWDVRGINPIEQTRLVSAFPEAWLPPAATPVTAYQIGNNAIQLAVRNVARAEGAPRVRLADQQIVWNGTSHYYGVVLFDLEPARLDRCRVGFPEQIELISLACEGIPVLAQPLGDRQWEFQLGYDELPQRIEVVFRGTMTPATTIQRETFQVPQLIGIPVEQTLWTIRGPQHARLATSLLPHTRQSAQELTNARVSATQDLLNLTDELAPAVEMTGQGVSVRDRWKERLEKQQHFAQLTRPDTQNAADVRPSRIPFARIEAAYNPRATPRFAGPESAIGFALQGASDRLSIDVTAPSAQPSLWNYVAAVGLLATLLLILWLTRVAWLRELLQQTPHLVGVLIGLAWWLFGTPSVIGLFVALLFAWGAIWPRWRGWAAV